MRHDWHDLLGWRSNRPPWDPWSHLAIEPLIDQGLAGTAPEGDRHRASRRRDEGRGRQRGVVRHRLHDERRSLHGRRQAKTRDDHGNEREGVPSRADETQAIWLYGLFFWAGPKCIDLQGSDELVSTMAQPYAKATRTLLDVPDDQFQWFACTSTVGVDSGVHYKPDEYRYVMAWSGSGGYSWSVEAEGDQERQQIVDALVAAT